MLEQHRHRTLSQMPEVLPVFPLTGVLLLPRARLPLNIFEPRYIAMTDAALAGARLIGIVQPETPGTDMAHMPALCQVGCAGRIVDFGETEDGRYRITLAGIARFRIASEPPTDTPYRRVIADYKPYACDFSTESEPEIAREQLLAALKPFLDKRDLRTDWQSIEEAPEEMLVNALSMICPFEPAEKQALIEAPTLKERAETLIALIEMANAAATAPGGGSPLN